MASNLVGGDTNGSPDVFVHDRQAGTTTRVSVASDGTQGNGSSFAPAISGDSQYAVAFISLASNLVAGDTNGTFDVFVYDRKTGTTRVSVASDGSQANSFSFSPAVSADGRYVAFDSLASNLVAGDTNGTWDVFVHDRKTGTTTRVSVASDGTQGNGVSFTGYSSVIGAHGRYVAFVSLASNLVAGDTNGIEDVFVHDRKTGTTTRVSVASDGSQGNNMSRGPAISGDGRSVTFESLASNLVAGDTNSLWDVFARDRETGTITKVSVASDGTHGNGVSRNPSISAAGRYAVFESLASNLVAGDTNGTWDVFVHDRKTGITTRVSVASDGTQGNGVSEFPSVGANGDLVAFRSSSSNLVTGDTNSTGDVFVHDEDD